MKKETTRLFDPSPIRKARMRKYRTQSEFAEYMDITRQTVSRMENAHDPISMSLLKKTCDELGLAFQILIYPYE